MSLLGESAYRETFTISSTLDATIPSQNAQVVVFECLTASTLTVTVDVLVSSSDASNVAWPCLLLDNGVPTPKAAGATITLTAGDLLLIPCPGFISVRVKRAGGSGTGKGYSHASGMTAVMLLAEAIGGVGTTIQPTAGTPVTTNPVVANATSVTGLAANTSRKYLAIQNNLNVNISFSLAGGALTSIIPSTANPCHVLEPGRVYECPPHYISVAAITVYQASGSSSQLITFTEG